MSVHVPAALRREVAQRAGHACEYCRVHENDTFFGCEIEHIISLKHGGVTESTNLAYACLFCNRHKGTDIAAIDRDTGELCRLFHPRHDRWSDHFAVEGTTIRPLTAVGRTTARLLMLNAADREIERAALIAAGRFPAST